MFLAHLLATGYAAPPELRIHRAALFYKYVAATRLKVFALGLGQSHSVAFIIRSLPLAVLILRSGRVMHSASLLRSAGALQS